MTKKNESDSKNKENVVNQVEGNSSRKRKTEKVNTNNGLVMEFDVILPAEGQKLTVYAEFLSN